MYKDFSASDSNSVLSSSRFKRLPKATHCLSIEKSSSQFGHRITSWMPQSHSISLINSKNTSLLQELQHNLRF